MRLTRWLGLPIAAAIAVIIVLTVQLSHGGGTYEPLKPPSPCRDEAVEPQASGIEGLTEQLVLTGLANAACNLDVSREELTLQIAQSGQFSAQQTTAMRQGLLAAVDTLANAGDLPRASDLLDEALTNADLNSYLERGIRLLPDRAINTAVDLDDVLHRAIESLDLPELLANLDDQSQLNQAVQEAVTQAIKDSIVARLKGLLPENPF